MKTPKDLYGFAKFFKEDGLYYFQFNAPEGRPVLYSHGYKSEKSRDNGIQAAIRNAGVKKQYKVEETKNGKYYFVLKSGNHQTICRSIVFDSKKETDKNLKTVIAIQKDVPVFDLQEEKKASERPDILVEPTPDKVAPPKETSEMPPRYKFSLIYYPDSEVWNIKHDLSGDSRQFKRYDGQMIEEFVMEHVSTKQMFKASTALPKTSRKKARPAPPKIIKEDILLKIRKLSGDLAQNFVTSHDMAGFQLLPKEGNWRPDPCSVKIKARSLEGSEDLLVGELRNQLPQEGKLLVPLISSEKLMPGIYRFLVSMQQRENDGAIKEMLGSQLVYLN